MASKDEAAAPSRADLFGDDTDSSNESVGGDDAAAKATNNVKAAAAAADGTAAAPENNDDENIREDTKMADSDDDEAEVGQKKSSANTEKVDLFGDDDSSSEDDEFQDDGIVGTTKKSSTGDTTSATAVATKDPPVVKTMNQTLGLDSDSDDDNDANRKDTGEGEDTTKAENDKPVYVPPRKMELLNLRTDNKNDDASSSSNNIVYHTVKLPNLVGINTTPYNSKTHDEKSEEEYFRGYVHNMIRWRYKYDEDTGELLREEGEDGGSNDDGALVRESNTRLVKWSDGSYTLHVGREVLEVDNLDSSVPMEAAGGGGGGGGKGVLPGFSGINGYLYTSQKARIRPPTKKELQGPRKEDDAEKKAADGETKENNTSDDDDDEVPPPTQPGGTVLECLGPIKSRFAPRPSSLTSAAHRNLTLAVRQRNVKRARIAEIVTDFDPESEKAKRIKSKDDLAKSRAARSGTARRSGGGGGGRRRGMNASYLEDDDDYDGVNLGRLKRQTMRGDRDNYNSDEEEELDYGQDSASSEEDEWSKKKTQKRGAAAARAARKDNEDDSSEDGEVVL